MTNAQQPAFPPKIYPEIASDAKDNFRAFGGFNPTGLTKREYFAAMAMQGILSNPANNDNDILGVNGNPDIGFIACPNAIREAIRYADELLKQLEK